MTASYVSYDFANDFKPRFDGAKALGFNCVQYFGDIVGVGQGTITLATYLARRKQGLDYCAKIGLFVLPIGSPYIGQYAGVSVATAIPILVADAQLCAVYPNVPGYACTDESVQSGGGAHAAEAVSEYTAVKAAVRSNFPITCSAFYVQSGNAEWADTAPYAAYCDFFLWNLNTGTPTGSAWNSMRSSFPNHEHFFNMGYGQNDGSFLTNFAAQNILGTNKVRGGTIFTQEDFDSGFGGIGWGLYAGIAPTSPRAARIAAAQSGFGACVGDIPGTRFRYGNPRLNQYRQWGF